MVSKFRNISQRLAQIEAAANEESQRLDVVRKDLKLTRKEKSEDFVMQRADIRALWDAVRDLRDDSRSLRIGITIMVLGFVVETFFLIFK